MSYKSHILILLSILREDVLNLPKIVVVNMSTTCVTVIPMIQIIIVRN